MAARFVLTSEQHLLDQSWVPLKHDSVFVKLLQEQPLGKVEHELFLGRFVLEEVELLAGLEIPLPKQADKDQVVPDALARRSEAMHFLEDQQRLNQLAFDHFDHCNVVQESETVLVRIQTQRQGVQGLVDALMKLYVVRWKLPCFFERFVAGLHQALEVLLVLLGRGVCERLMRHHVQVET